jgi:hypothetical protein
VTASPIYFSLLPSTGGRHDNENWDNRDNLDPLRAWDCMMQGEKPGGHGERCVAVGTLDMALWDAALSRISTLSPTRAGSCRVSGINQKQPCFTSPQFSR